MTQSGRTVEEFFASVLAGETKNVAPEVSDVLTLDFLLGVNGAAIYEVPTPRQDLWVHPGGGRDAQNLGPVRIVEELSDNRFLVGTDKFPPGLRSVTFTLIQT